VTQVAVTQGVLQMKQSDIAALQGAYEGGKVKVATRPR
jgi:hypothetical protein